VSSLLVNVEGIDDGQASLLGQRLLKVSGIAEAVVVAEEGVAYLKVDKGQLDRVALGAAFEAIKVQ
jgi:hypothetical protein